MKNLLFVLVFCTGCLKTYVQRAPDLAAGATTDALMVSTQVTTAQESNDSSGGLSLGNVVEGAMDVAANAKTDQFGSKVVDSMTDFMVAQGFQPVLDQERVKALQKVDWGEMTNSLSALSGAYTDPRGASIWVSPKMLFRKKVLEKTAQNLSLTDGEAMFFLTVTVHESRKWLIMRYPLIQVTVVVADSSGRELLKAQGIGEGSSSVIVIDRSPDNLQRGLDNANAELAAAEVQTLAD